MLFLIQCTTCGCQVWMPGWYEPDTNAAGISEQYPLPDEACEHLREGEDFKIVDEEYDDKD